MPRNDVHLDSMLRHLGAAYYESQHGRATRADVTRALGIIEDSLGERAQRSASGASGMASTRQEPHDRPAGGHPAGPAQPHGWARRVSDVMTTSVVTVDRVTPYKEIARLLAGHRVSGLPVLKMGREVAGVVTEADLLAVQAKTAQRVRSAARQSRWPRWSRGERHPALTAGELMSAPAITIGPLATVPAAARLMSTRHVRRLPVVSEHGMLIGMVSRRDLLSVFLRPDEDIAADTRRVLDEVLAPESEEASVTVRNGIVTLTGSGGPRTGPHEELIPLAIRLMWDVDGVVDIIDQLGQPQAAPARVPGP
jgi:CBS domain-containing protein